MTKGFFARMLAMVLAAVLIVPTSLAFLPQAARAQLSVITVPGSTITVTNNSAPSDLLDLAKNTVTSVATVGTQGSTAALVLKTYVLDPLARALIQTLLRSITASVVNWINGQGSGGSPLFVQNLQGLLLATADSAALNFIGQIGQQSNSPFASAIASSLQTNYLQSTSAAGFWSANQCTLSSASPNINSFLAGNFNQGGWNAWFSLTTQPQNNPYTFYYTAQSQLNSLVSSAQSQQQSLLNWGNGFSSWCGTPNVYNATTGQFNTQGLAQQTQQVEQNQTNQANQTANQQINNEFEQTSQQAQQQPVTYNDSGVSPSSLTASAENSYYDESTGQFDTTGLEQATQQAPQTQQTQLNQTVDQQINNESEQTSQQIQNSSLSPSDITSIQQADGIGGGASCTQTNGTPGIVQTPGTVMVSSLDQSLGSGIASLVNAHYIDEMISTIAGALMQQALGGLAGLSQPSYGGSSSYLNQYQGADSLSASDGSGSTIGSDISSTLSSEISTTVSGITDFQNAWQIIGNAAESASSSVESLLSCYQSHGEQDSVAAGNALTNEIAPVLTQAANAQAAAEAALTLASSTEELANSTETTTGITQAATQYQELTTMPPSSTDISTAESNSQVTGGATSANQDTLTVSGGTTVDQMDLINTNANIDLTACVEATKEQQTQT